MEDQEMNKPKIKPRAEYQHRDVCIRFCGSMKKWYSKCFCEARSKLKMDAMFGLSFDEWLRISQKDKVAREGGQIPGIKNSEIFFMNMKWWNPTPGHISRENSNLKRYIHPKKSIIQKESCTTMFIAALFTIARTWKQPKCPLTDEWLKMWHICTMEYYSAIERHGTELFVMRWMDLESLIQSEVSQRKRKTNTIC